MKFTKTVTLESRNYLIVYLDIKDAKPGKMQLTFTKDKQQLKQEYELKARSKKGEEHVGFDSSDVLYLLMPDRFANGDESIDNIKGMSDYKVDRTNPSGRHGGDMKGIEQHLDYFTELGVTALWFTPVLENNMLTSDWHGISEAKDIFELIRTEEIAELDAELPVERFLPSVPMPCE